jgi:hypothetical protein
LSQFENRAPFSTWLTRIVVHEALARVRKRNRTQSLEFGADEGESPVNPSDCSPDPEQNTSQLELGRMLEEAILALPDEYRGIEHGRNGGSVEHQRRECQGSAFSRARDAAQESLRARGRFSEKGVSIHGSTVRPRCAARVLALG